MTLGLYYALMVLAAPNFTTSAGVAQYIDAVWTVLPELTRAEIESMPTDSLVAILKPRVESLSLQLKEFAEKQKEQQDALATVKKFLDLDD